MKIFLLIKQSTTILLSAVVFTLLPLIAATLLLSREGLVSSLHAYTVITGSMEPLVPVGSVVYVFQSNSYLPGDIISFNRGKINVTHRIIRVVHKGAETYYQTKGDANNAVDGELVPENKVTGEILFHFPYVGRFMAFLRSIPGFLIFIVLPTVGFIGFELWNIKKEIELETEKRVMRKLSNMSFLRMSSTLRLRPEGQESN